MPKVKKTKKPKWLEPLYSGKQSTKFWERVNKIRGREGNAVYVAGCLLQDVESRVLQILNYAEQEEE